MTNFKKDITNALNEVLAYVEGKETGIVKHNIKTDEIDVKKIRHQLNLTQVEMALLLGTSASGLIKWEQGTRKPHGAAKTLLRVMEKEPNAIIRTLIAS